MGLNLDLHEIFAELPETGLCPQCGAENGTYFDDYDIECGKPFPNPGEMKLNLYCDDCGHKWSLHYKIRLEPGE